jgi:hypothetical protein
MKSTLTAIFKILGGALAVASFVTLVFKLSVAYERSAARDSEILMKVNNIEGLVLSVDTKQDELSVKLNDLQRSQSEVVASQNALRSSYVNYLKNDKSLTKEAFLNYMEGIAWKIEEEKKNGSLQPIH